METKTCWNNKKIVLPPRRTVVFMTVGAAVSLLCLIMSGSVVLLIMGGALSLTSVMEAHAAKPILWIFDVGSILMGAVCGLVARRWEITARGKRELEQRIRDHTAGLEDANRRLQLKIAQQQRIEAELESAQLETARLIGKLEKVNRHLNNAVDQVEELTNQVESARRAQNQLVLNLDRQLRSPLNDIIGMTRMASDVNDEQQRKDCLASANANAQNVLAVIDELLNSQPGEAGEWGEIGSSRPRSPLRILVADDNVVSQIVISRLLKSDNHALVFGDAGKEVVELLDSETFDLVLVGLHLPDMSGVEATGIIREREKFRGTYTPIVGLISEDEKEEGQRGIDSGMDAVLVKPVDRGSLRGIIHNVQKKITADRYGQSLEAATEARLLNRRENQPA